MAQSRSASSVTDEIVQKARAAYLDEKRNPQSPGSWSSNEREMRAALEAVWPEPLLNDAELAAVIVALRFTDSGESHEDVMSAITKLEAEDNRRYDESDGHA
jgi:hypothetical protein